MRCPLVSFVILSLSFVSFAELSLSPYVLHEKRTSIPSGWSLARRHDVSSALPLCFALKQTNIENVGDFLLDRVPPRLFQLW